MSRGFNVNGPFTHLLGMLARLKIELKEQHLLRVIFGLVREYQALLRLSGSTGPNHNMISTSNLIERTRKRYCTQLKLYGMHGSFKV